MKKPKYLIVPMLIVLAICTFKCDAQELDLKPYKKNSGIGFLMRLYTISDTNVGSQTTNAVNFSLIYPLTIQSFVFFDSIYKELENDLYPRFMDSETHPFFKKHLTNSMCLLFPLNRDILPSYEKNQFQRIDSPSANELAELIITFSGIKEKPKIGHYLQLEKVLFSGEILFFKDFSLYEISQYFLPEESKSVPIYDFGDYQARIQPLIWDSSLNTINGFFMIDFDQLFYFNPLFKKALPSGFMKKSTQRRLINQLYRQNRR
jgi:hypothetical protein